MGNWTIDTLREYFDLRMNELEKRLVGERALLVAANADRSAELERRLTLLNELRNEVLADRALFVTRDTFQIVAERLNATLTREYYEQQHEVLNKEVTANTATIATIRTRSAAFAAAIAICVTVLTAVILVIQIAH